jgi:hypothetical protein
MNKKVEQQRFPKLFMAFKFTNTQKSWFWVDLLRPGSDQKGSDRILIRNTGINNYNVCRLEEPAVPSASAAPCQLIRQSGISNHLLGFGFQLILFHPNGTGTRNSPPEMQYRYPMLRIRIRDPVPFYPNYPGSGSGIRDDFFSESRISDPGSLLRPKLKILPLKMAKNRKN